MPRRVPLLKLEARLAWAMTGLSPWDLNSFWQNARAKKPRESSLRSKSITKAPLSLASVKITAQLLIGDPYPLPANDDATLSPLQHLKPPELGSIAAAKLTFC